ncbi:hypothetical protein DV735_g1724, partial [Chaetothyriales sp. CBS 134920]
MDEFAQSRDDNDLFDDEITPLEPGQTSDQVNDPTESVPLERLTIEPDEVQPPNEQMSTATPNDIPASAPTGPSKPRPAPPSLDRHLTGGPPPKPKLSEAELSAKLALAKLKAESRAAAHARAEADKEAHEARERAKAGREWDEQKDDGHHRGPGPARDRVDGYRWKDGAEAADLSQYEWHDGRDDEDFPSLPAAGAWGDTNPAHTSQAWGDTNPASTSQAWGDTNPVQAAVPKSGEASTNWAEEVELAGAW